MAIKRDETKEAKKFGVVLAVVLLPLGGWFYYRQRELAPYICWAIGAPSLLLPFAAPGLWLKFFRLWMKGAEAISWVMTRVILSVFFYLLMTPVGLVLRMLGKTPLDLKWRDGRSTYWIDKPAGEYTLERYRKQY